MIDSKLIRWRKTPQVIGFFIKKPNVNVGDVIQHEGIIGTVCSLSTSGEIICVTEHKKHFTIFPD